MKTLIKLFLLLAVIFSWNTAFAYDFEVDGIYYEVISASDLTCKVVKGEQEYSGDIVIPAEVPYRNRTLKVISVGTGFRNNKNLTSITLPNSVTTIGNSAFQGCSSLTSIEIPNSVTNIGESAFNGCSSLTSIEIPNSVTSIGHRAFYGCSSLKSIKLPNSVTEIGSYAFEDCSSLTNIEIPNSVTIIWNHAFYGCSSLTSIEIPNSVTSIKSDTFNGCSSLTNIEIPNSVTEIGRYAFEDCSSLTNIEIPNSVTTIGGYTFRGCTNLKNVKLSDNMKEISDGTFYNCKSLESIVIPGCIKEIYLGDLQSSDHVTFGNCNNLRTIRFEYNPNKLLWESWTAELYKWTNTLETIFIDRRLNYPISVLESLKEVVIGEHLDELDVELKNAEKLTTITSYATVPPKISECTHSQYLDVKVRVPNEALEAYRKAYGWKEFWDLEGFDTSGVDEIQTATEKTEVARYNLLGAPVSEDYEGIVIVRYSDGSTRKVVNK